MQYKVPQDVQREDRIIGPLTLKQMIICGIGGAIAYAIYISLAKTYYMEIWLPPIAIVAAITLAFAFLKIHSLPFHIFLMAFAEFHLLPRKRVWVQGTGAPFISSLDRVKKKEDEGEDKKSQIKAKSLEELTTIVDTYGESELPQENKKEELKKLIDKNYK